MAAPADLTQLAYEREGPPCLAGQVTAGGSLASFTCDQARGPGTDLVKVPCERPDDAGLTASLGIVEGRVRLTVLDGSGHQVLSEVYAPTSEPFDEHHFGANATAGEWTALVERSDDFAGSYAIGVLCGA